MGGRDLARMRGGARRFEGEQGLRLGVIQQSRSGGEARKTLSRCQSVKRYFLSFFLPFFPFLMCPCVRWEEGIVMGIWCQTSKPFYSFREPPGQNIVLGPPGVSRQETRQSAEVLSCSESVAWLGLSACFYSLHFLFHTRWD